MIPLLLGAVGTAVSLYSLMGSTEKACSTIDNYVEDNVDIISKTPVLGYAPMICLLRSKQERRIIEAYNELIISCTDKVLKGNLKSRWKHPAHKFTKPELTLIFRIGTGLNYWWGAGFVGQVLFGSDTIDPKVKLLFSQLSDSDKALIARTQSLISVAEERDKK